MNILYIGYWNLNDGLTQATIFPGLRMLRDLLPTSKILFANIQREELRGSPPSIFDELNVLYCPIPSGDRVINKLRDFFYAPKVLQKLCDEHNITKVIARGTPAGALAYLLWKRARIPFYVESFEPHARYMVESGVWSTFDLRYILQSYWERQQKKFAHGLMPVTINYKNQLIEESVPPEMIKVVPCIVDEVQFSFKEDDRLKIRRKCNIPEDAIVGIYAGKYDGLYMAEESFELYNIFFSLFPGFYLILLSPAGYHSWISKQIEKYSLPMENIILLSVQHSEVGAYCSTSDFAFATYKPGSSKKYLSPVKVGEYWANGLPVFLTQGVGDEAAMIEKGFGGVLFDPGGINPSDLSVNIKKLLNLIGSKSIRESIAKTGIAHRSIEKLKVAYNYFLFQK